MSAPQHLQAKWHIVDSNSACKRQRNDRRKRVVADEEVDANRDTHHNLRPRILSWMWTLQCSFSSLISLQICIFGTPRPQSGDVNQGPVSPSFRNKPNPVDVEHVGPELEGTAPVSNAEVPDVGGESAKGSERHPMAGGGESPISLRNRWRSRLPSSKSTKSTREEFGAAVPANPTGASASGPGRSSVSSGRRWGLQPELEREDWTDMLRARAPRGRN
jgi:hypothetical protein